ncbi:MAG: amino acid ABC transporter permease [Desulfovibrio sp.]|nr:MAG: amino acid ABC transporter permease [Desulfovibrio sp.]
MRQSRVRIRPLDLILIALCIAAGVWFLFLLKERLHYEWNWGAIPRYLFRHDDERGWVPNLLVQGLLTTIRLSLWSIVLATFIGTAMGLARTSKLLFLRLLGQAYVIAIRNVPPLVLIFIFYFFFSEQIMTLLDVDGFIRSRSETTTSVLSWLCAPPATFTHFVSAVLTIAIYEGAYITEIVRSGVESVERGQWEAAWSLGLTPWQRMRAVILPQAMRRIIPPMAGQLISTIKDSAIVSVISVQELTFQAMELTAVTSQTGRASLIFEIWITATAMYLLLTLTCSLIARQLEVRLNRHRA